MSVTQIMFIVGEEENALKSVEYFMSFLSFFSNAFFSKLSMQCFYDRINNKLLLQKRIFAFANSSSSHIFGRDLCGIIIKL